MSLLYLYCIVKYHVHIAINGLQVVVRELVYK